MTAQTDALTSLKDRFRRRSLIEDALAMLYWDRSTLMPDGAADARTDQIAELTRMAREILVAAETSDLLDQAEQVSESLAPLDARDLHLMRRAFLLETAVPADLVEAAQRAGVGWIGKSTCFAMTTINLSSRAPCPIRGDQL